MFSKNVTENDRFKDMSMSAQCLYFHLGMQADDDGFLDTVRSVQRSIGATNDDVKQLIAKNYLIDFHDGIFAIKDWPINNQIKKDRYRPTVYQDDFRKLEYKNSSQPYRLLTKEQMKRKMDPKRIQSGSSLDTQSSLGQSRIVQSRSGQVRSGQYSLVKDRSSQSKSSKPIKDKDKYKKIESYIRVHLQTSVSKSDKPTLKLLISQMNTNQVYKVIDKVSEHTPSKPVPYLIKALKNRLKDPFSSNYEDKEQVCEALEQFLTRQIGVHYSFNEAEKKAISDLLDSGATLESIEEWISKLSKKKKDISVINDLTPKAYKKFIDNNIFVDDDIPF